MRIPFVHCLEVSLTSNIISSMLFCHIFLFVHRQHPHTRPLINQLFTISAFSLYLSPRLSIILLQRLLRSLVLLLLPHRRNITQTRDIRQYLIPIQLHQRSFQRGRGRPHVHFLTHGTPHATEQIRLARAYSGIVHVGVSAPGSLGMHLRSAIDPGRDEVGSFLDGDIVSERHEVHLVHFVGEIHRFLIVVVVPLFGRFSAIRMGHPQQRIPHQFRQIANAIILLHRLHRPLLRLQQFQFLLLHNALHQLPPLVMRIFEHGK
mmetsp:Transcript_3259/g.8308  ORF Transcript_3259/g.8308 Transcript_3259/m.8308 type:complete len:262 (-) Transcript_3259:859-1644(-)